MPAVGWYFGQNAIVSVVIVLIPEHHQISIQIALENLVLLGGGKQMLDEHDWRTRHLRGVEVDVQVLLVKWVLVHLERRERVLHCSVKVGAVEQFTWRELIRLDAIDPVAGFH